MGQQLDLAPDMADSKPAVAATATSSSFTLRAGLLGGMIGGLLGGMIGGVAGGPIGSTLRGPVATIEMPAGDELLLSVLTGGIFGASGGVLLGALGGWIIGRVADKWGVFFCTLGSLFFASIVAPIEAGHRGTGAAIAGFIVSAAALMLVGVGLGAVFVAIYRFRLLRWLTIGWLLLCVGGAIYSSTRTAQVFAQAGDKPAEPIVQLRCASLPPPLGAVARHCWFAVYDLKDRRWHRWEVWQFKGKGNRSWEHLRMDLMDVDSGVGGGSFEVVQEWSGDEARAIMTAIEKAKTEFAHRSCYIAWPGPNCNTYIVWVLNEAGVPANLPPLAVGQHYYSIAGIGITARGTGLEMKTATIGCRVGLSEGAELHFLTMPVGIDVLRPAIVTPAGRVGFAK